MQLLRPAGPRLRPAKPAFTSLQQPGTPISFSPAAELTAESVLRAVRKTRAAGAKSGLAKPNYIAYSIAAVLCWGVPVRICTALPRTPGPVRGHCKICRTTQPQPVRDPEHIALASPDALSDSLGRGLHHDGMPHMARARRRNA